jgi:hypothetical protein
MSRQIEVVEQCTSEVGNCNGCQDRSGPGQRYRVWHLVFRSLSLRLCDTCIVEFRGKLSPAADTAVDALAKAPATPDDPAELPKQD